ncbi:MAG: hypothetical protein KY455_13040 [Euryarchaeota archaeon]|nr:hypothetical protein [Euryarchaeota archaeon]
MRLVLHGHPRPQRFDQKTFLQGLRAVLPAQVETGERPPLLETPTDEPVRHAARIGATRVLDPFRPPHHRVVCSNTEHALERDILSGVRAPTGRPPPEGELYDAAQLSAVARDLLPVEERRLDIIHLVLTDRLIGTYQRSDGRYHARVILAGTPHLLSTAGLVEAPARSRGYYAALAQGPAGPGRGALESALMDEQLVHGDPRIPHMMVGYALMAYFWQVHGEAFCSDPHCRLYNAHWQRELIQAQSGGLCDHHATMLHHHDAP